MFWTVEAGDVDDSRDALVSRQPLKSKLARMAEPGHG